MGFGGEFLNCIKSLYVNDSVDSVVNGITTRSVFLQRGLRQGCSLSPLLFSLYISDIGNDLMGSSDGFMIGGLSMSILLFADDIILISKSFDGLERLIRRVKEHCDGLKLTISESKSNFVTNEDIDNILLLSENNDIILSLKKSPVLQILGN